MRSSCLFHLLVFLQLWLAHAADFRMTNAVCESHNKSWIEFEVCRLRAVSRKRILLNINLTLNYPITEIFLKAQLMKKANGYKPWLYKYYFSACQFARRRNNPVIRLVWDLFKDFSTLNHSCPYVGKQVVKDFYLKPDRLPTPIPTGEYLLVMNWIMYNRSQAETNIYFNYVEDL